jgi:hypothetical protein
VVVTWFAATAALGLTAGLTLATALSDGLSSGLGGGLGGGLAGGPSHVGAVVAAVGGFAVLGAGISVTFPALLAEAGATSDRPAEAVGAVSTGGYVGFLVGPPLIGSVAQVAGLPVALWIIPMLAAGAAAVTAAGSPRPRR